VLGDVADEEIISGDGMGDDWVATVNNRNLAPIQGEPPTISSEGCVEYDS